MERNRGRADFWLKGLRKRTGALIPIMPGLAPMTSEFP